MPVDKELVTALKVSEDAEDEEISASIVALLTSATHDEKPEYTLADIYHLISQSGASSLLDPLNLVPLLISSRDAAAKDILALIGQCGSPKEVVMAVQEAVERLEESLRADDADDEDNEARKDGKKKTLSLPGQLGQLVELYASAIPKLKLRRKTASETVRPLLLELDTAVSLASGRASKDEGRLLISNVSILAAKVIGWAKDFANVDEVKGCKDILVSLLDATITACARCIHSSVAQRTFEKCFPRLTVRSAVEAGWEEGDSAMSQAIEAYEALDNRPKTIISAPSTISLILLAYTDTESLDPDTLLSSLSPILVASIQSNAVLDESLSILIKTLHRRQLQPRSDLSADIIGPLSTVIPTLSSAHPDPLVRHQAFRVLSMLLSLSPSQLRLQILTELTTKSEFPQMRVASVGLVKEAVLEALSNPSSTNVFSSPMLLRVFGPILFRPNPPDLFSEAASLDALQESQESSRLVECLALYYILLQRDVKNLTGIRDKDVISSVEKSLLLPLRNALGRWMEDQEIANNHMHEIMPLVSLKMSLERVDAARAALMSTS
ncbi:hypothetical protein BDQ12DRAFT_678392 [Crucibulum laeve]|uniref:Rho-GAP domain-containing protein n=1 Tax=Crucibulum laeve TaxID=68775 RepID=A0A5C3MB81_9AGAR|nr:hypothetical protein BDQ12DRAFT_678392 [Crucibulum laeve]